MNQKGHTSIYISDIEIWNQVRKEYPYLTMSQLISILLRKLRHGEIEITIEDLK
jgi:hypothetical protein